MRKKGAKKVPGHRIEWRALDAHILAVAIEDYGKWRVFIGSVLGKDHNKEWNIVWTDGTLLPEKIAKAIFPSFSELPYRE